MCRLSDELQALVLSALRPRVDAGVMSPDESRALLELAEAQRDAIAELRRDATVHASLMIGYGELAAEWLDLVGILRLAGLEVGQSRLERPGGRGAGGWYWKVGGQSGEGYADVISAYRAGLPVLIADLIACQVVPDCSGDAARLVLSELRNLHVASS